MASFADRLSEIIESTGASYSTLASQLNVSKSTVAAWRVGERVPKLSTINTIAQTLDISVAWLCGESDIKTRYEGNLLHTSPLKPIESLGIHRIPVLGKIAAGTPIYDEYVNVHIDSTIEADFALEIEGNSMYPKFLDGDTLYVREHSTLDYDGQILVIAIDDEITLKKVYKKQEGILLVSLNPEYEPMFYSKTHTFRILGLPVGYTRLFKGGEIT